MDILKNGDCDLLAFTEHLNSLHPNLKWETASGREGAYLDLWLSLEDGKIQTKVYNKSEPIYLHPSSCHDTSVFKGLVSGVGRRLRLNCSKDEDFREAVVHYARAFAVSGHSYQRPLNILMESEKLDRVKILKNLGTNTRRSNKRNQNTRKLYWISDFDPRIPNQRQIITRNYHLMVADPDFSKLYPRKNIISDSPTCWN